MQPNRLYPDDSKGGGHHGRLPAGRHTRDTDHPGKPGQLCVHVCSGRVDAPRFCTLRFECYHCGYDQLLDELDLIAVPIVKPTDGYLS